MHHNAASAAYAGQHHPQQTTNQQQQSYQQQSQFGPISGGHYDHHHHAAAALAAQQQQQRHHQEQQQQQQYSYNTPEANYQVEQQQQQGARTGQNPSIRWQQSNGSGTPPTGTTAERRLPFVHRFHRGGGNQQQANQGSSTGNVLIQPYHSHSGNSQAGGGSAGHSGQDARTHAQHSHHRSQASYAAQQVKREEKRARNMAQYETNPIGALQERFQSRGIIPDYKFLNTDGASHCPTFTFQVTVGDITASGNGQTKKQAKQAAAKSMLDILDGRAPSGGDAAAATPAKPAADGANGEAGKEGEKAVENGKKPAAQFHPQVGNKIGLLQEHCVFKGLPMPVYEVQHVGGQPHQRIFSIGVKVGSLALTGEGTSKKESKREAATKMYDKLKELQKEGALGLVNGSNVKLEPGSHPDNSETANFKGIETLTGKGRDQIAKFFGDLTAGKNSVMHSLHRAGASVVSAAGPNYVKFLKDLAEEQKFAVTYVELDEPVEGGGVMSLAQISSMPVAVCHGVGANIEAANNEAARSALVYLKMMTKKKAAGTVAAAAAGEGQATASTENSKANGQRKKK